MKSCICPRCESIWVDGFSVDPVRGCAEWPGGRVHLRPRWLQILAVLMERPRSYAFLAELLWGADPNGGPNGILQTLHQHAHHCRRALLAAGCPYTIRTNVGHGLELARIEASSAPTPQPRHELTSGATA